MDQKPWWANRAVISNAVVILVGAATGVGLISGAAASKIMNVAPDLLIGAATTIVGIVALILELRANKNEASPSQPKAPGNEPLQVDNGARRLDEPTADRSGDRTGSPASGAGQTEVS